MDISGMSDRAVLREIGRRLRRTRLGLNLTQAAVGERAGLDRMTVGQIERGSSGNLLTLIQILRALDALDELDAFLPDPGVSPLELARLKGRQRRRASRRSAVRKDEDREW